MITKYRETELCGSWCDLSRISPDNLMNYSRGCLVTMSLLCPGICHNSTQCVLIHETISGRSDGVKSSVFTVSGFITNSVKLKGNKGGGYEKLLLMID